MMTRHVTSSHLFRNTIAEKSALDIVGRFLSDAFFDRAAYASARE